MRNFVLLLLIVTALLVWNRWYRGQTQTAHAPKSGTAAESVSGGPVRQLEQAPSNIMGMEAAMPSGGGTSPKAMLDSVKQGVQNAGQ